MWKLAGFFALAVSVFADGSPYRYEEFTVDETNKKYVIVMTRRVNLPDANKYCSNHHDGSLASVPDVATREALNGYLKQIQDKYPNYRFNEIGTAEKTNNAVNQPVSKSDDLDSNGQFCAVLMAWDPVNRNFLGDTYSMQSKPCDRPRTFLCELQESSSAADSQSNELVNLALGKPTTQDSVSSGGVPSRGNDGNANTNYNQGRSCTHTGRESKGPGRMPWWAIDLEQVEAIGSVSIINRHDCCPERLHSIQVFATDVMPSPGFRPPVVSLCGTYGGPAGRGEVVEIQCASGFQGQYIVIQKTVGDHVLTMCEVYIYPGPASPPRNVALHQPTSKSSNNPKWEGPSSRAVDGNENTKYSGNSCTNSEPYEYQSWWAVDLGREYRPVEVVIVSRGDRCCDTWLHDIVVYSVPKMPTLGTKLDPNVRMSTCGKKEGIIPGGSTFILQCDRSFHGRYVVVQHMDSDDNLNLCEVKVMAS